MEYLIKSSAIIFMFYVCYKVFLQRDTFFESNRWFLLAGLIISSCIGFIVIPEYIEYTPIKISSFTINPTISTSAAIEEEPFNYMLLLYWIYSIGVIYFIGQLCIQLLSLRRILLSGKNTQIDKYIIVETKNDITPFSFFNYVVYNPNQFNASELAHVINHEKAHSKQWHSIDTIIAQIACILLWFNPFVWLYKKALQQNLEFIADQKAQYFSPCEKSYQTVLLKASVQNHHLELTNNFYTSLIKKRIIMLHKSKSKKWNQFKLLIVLPLLALFIMSFNVKEIYVEKSASEDSVEEVYGKDNESIEIIFTKNTSDDDLQSIKETLKSKGIDFSFSDVKRNSEGEITSINTEFKSEKNSSNYNISGDKGIKSFRFVSNDNQFSVGTMEKNSFIFESKHSSTKAQSSNGSSKVIVIEESDENSSTTVDVKVIQSKDSKGASKNHNTFVFSSDDNDSDEPIFIINGKKVDKSLFEDVDSDDIQSVIVIKGEKALEKYGDEGKNGVIVMTKKGSNSFVFESENDDDEVIIESKHGIHIETDGKSSPLFIVDDVIVEEDKIHEINTNSIDRVEVIKELESVKEFGDKGKDGVVKIYTKKSKGLNSTEDSFLIVESTGSDLYTVHESHEIMIHKSMSDTELNTQKSELKALGIDAKFSRIKRNKADEITSIKISLDDNKGSKSSASWKEKEQAIPNIVMGKHGNKLFINSQ